MYITFSRNLNGQRKLMKILAESMPKRKEENVVVLRGAKTVQRLVKLADQCGFKKVLIVNKKGETFSAHEIKITRKGSELNWKFGKKAMKVPL